MRKKIILIVAVGAIAGTAAVFAFRNSGAKQNGPIKLSGNIELTEVNIGFKTAGRLIERTVDEGDKVTRGQVLARLDRAQLEAQEQGQQASIASARGALAQANTSIAWQKQTLEGDIGQRRAEVDQARARLEQFRNGARPQEILEANAAVDAAHTEAERAKKEWDRVQPLYKQDDISASQYDQYRARYETAEAALRQANQRAELVKAGPRQEEIAGAAAQYARAKAALQTAEASRLELRRRQEEIGVRRAEIDRARAQATMIGSQLQDTVATSPISGVVLVKSADPGEVLAPGTSVVTVGDIDHPWLRGYIGERDLGRVKLGAKAKITTDSFPGKVYWGRVSFIASEAEFTPKQIQTKEERVKLVYRIKIEADNPQHELKLNMPVDAEILLD